MEQSRYGGLRLEVPFRGSILGPSPCLSLEACFPQYRTTRCFFLDAQNCDTQTVTPMLKDSGAFNPFLSFNPRGSLCCRPPLVLACSRNIGCCWVGMQGTVVTTELHLSCSHTHPHPPPPPPPHPPPHPPTHPPSYAPARTRAHEPMAWLACLLPS